MRTEDCRIWDVSTAWSDLGKKFDTWHLWTQLDAPNQQTVTVLVEVLTLSDDLLMWFIWSPAPGCCVTSEFQLGSVRVYFIFSEKSHVKTFFFTWCFQKATESTCSEWGCSSEVNMQIFSSILLKMGILCISTGAELEKFWVKGGGCSKAVALPYPAVDPPLHKHVSFMLFYSAWVDFRWKYYINYCLKCIYKPFTVL